jgi:hypothetical protein
MGTVIDQIVSLIDETPFVQRHKGFPHCLGQPFIHREPLACPVAGTTDLLQLFGDGRMMPLLDFPSLLHEFLTSQILSAQTFGCQLAFHNVLCRNPSMVGTRDPEGWPSTHPMVSDQCVLQLVVQCMAHMKDSGNVRWRHDYRERFAGSIRIRLETTMFFPIRVNPVLEIFRVVRLLKLHSFHGLPPRVCNFTLGDDHPY